jgi:hypothetical protein
MVDPALAPLVRWENFYVIVGGAAGALTGLQFVVIALVADVGQRSTNAEIDAFATPTIVHFVVALWLSALLSAPWNELSSAAIMVALTGVVGLIYAIIVIRRAHRQTGYEPVFEDWLWHAALPVVGYTSLLGAGLTLLRYERAALFTIGGVALLLVFIGIHNAWDTVTWITVRRSNNLPIGNVIPKPDPKPSSQPVARKGKRRR